MRKEHIGIGAQYPFSSHLTHTHVQKSFEWPTRSLHAGPVPGGWGSCGGEVLLSGHSAGVEDYVYRDGKRNERVGCFHYGNINHHRKSCCQSLQVGPEIKNLSE